MSTKTAKRKNLDGEESTKKKPKPKNSKNGKKKREEEEDDSEFDDNVSSNEEDAKSDVEEQQDEEETNFKMSLPEQSGTLLVTGGMNWDLNGRSKVPANGKNVGRFIYEPMIFAPLDDVKVKLAISAACAAHNVIITEGGKVLVFGRNEKGQLGVGDTERRDQPTAIKELEDLVIVNASVGKNHTLFLTEKGHVYACGDNQFGQCGVKNKEPIVLRPTRIKYSGPPIVKISCGGDFCMILNVKGVLFSFGLPEYGQLGLGTTGEYIQTAGKVLHNCERAPVPVKQFIEKGKDNHPKSVEVSDIVDVVCGTNHTVCIDSRNRAFSWGYGAYGRLGHSDNKDELLPRLIKFFDSQNRKVKTVWCGSLYTFAINDLNQLFFWGLTKKTSEANMYPKPFHDLSGWNIRSIGCSLTSVLFAAEDTVVSWGGSPTYGELGLGPDKKSSANPMENKKLSKVYVHSISCGISHTLLVARTDTEEERDRINEKFDDYEPPKP